MTIRVWLKHYGADKVLRPVREAIVTMLQPATRVLEIGCGTGDLLFRAANTIDYGLGVDLDPEMIKFAEHQKQKNNITNVNFICKNALEISAESYPQFDVATSTLCLHELTLDEAGKMLLLMQQHARRIIIADYAQANTLKGRISIEIDELLSGHYMRFRAYRRQGYIPQLAKQLEMPLLDSRASPFDGIDIWVLSGKSHDA